MLSRLLRADDTRKSRFHTSKGTLVVSPDFFLALGSTLKRILLGKYPVVPWLTYPAIRFLDVRLEGRRLFEFGSGSSTAWFAHRCREVVSVENNPGWFEMVRARLSASPNTLLSCVETDADMIQFIGKVGGKFDAVVVDSQAANDGVDRTVIAERTRHDDNRVDCLRAAIPFASDDCIFIIDNTDAHPNLDQALQLLFKDWKIMRFSGWAPGILHPNETTIICRK